MNLFISQELNLTVALKHEHSTDSNVLFHSFHSNACRILIKDNNNTNKNKKLLFLKICNISKF